MYRAIAGLHQPAPTGIERQIVGPITREWFSRTWPIALYFTGAMVAALGLGLVAAYGWVLVGGPIAVCGLAAGTIGNRRWPDPALGVSSVSALRELLERSRGPRR